MSEEAQNAVLRRKLTGREREDRQTGQKSGKTERKGRKT